MATVTFIWMTISAIIFCICIFIAGVKNDENWFGLAFGLSLIWPAIVVVSPLLLIYGLGRLVGEWLYNARMQKLH